MWKIRNTPAGWDVTDPHGALIGRADSYAAAVVVVAGAARDALVAAALAGDSPGLLPETWIDSGGVAFAEPTGPRRDFTNVQWSWRDPSAGFVPLMFAAKPEGDGHAGSELAGFVTGFSETYGTVHASGRLYDSDVGTQLRDMLLDGRIMGVSVDPSENVDAQFVCTEEDADGFCLDGMVSFTQYEIAGITAHPFPGLSRAAIQLEVAAPAVEQPIVTAISASPFVSTTVPVAWFYDSSIPAAPAMAITAAAPVAPPARWFTDPRLSEPTPMTVTDTGQIFGHVACWGTCHISYEDVCVTPPASETEYAYFRTGELRCEDGSRVPVGTLTMGIGHASLEMSAQAAIAHYDDTRHGVADLAAGEDAFGIWIAGAVRPDLSDVQLRTLRAASPSGDWRRLRGSLELVAALCVNVPGFPVPRVQARTAGGVCSALIASGPTLAVGDRDGETVPMLRMRSQLLVLEEAVRPQLLTTADAHLARIRAERSDDAKSVPAATPYRVRVRARTGIPTAGRPIP